MTASWAWMTLLAAGICEVMYASAIPRTQGFTRLWPSLYCIFFIALSMYLLVLAARYLPMGTAYAVWVGIGAVGTAIYGIVYLNEPATLARLVCLVLIICGVAGLKLFSPVG
ncbi:QacE family quaternary ammonium compound efflux SMR transporter [Pseudomonas daroniae]|uniref:Guanidinium exporter n=1 Tax=Phytopseudomonas daroniae TaxID=2487519 RepID=A0A4Q9QHP5_9GAMM|nr:MULTISPECIES: multidrug efflux SMR transporter [Pseudomonas]TBU73091.1 QacE family quaternary ammonium compound efflux SMR transporter [Pseudomonas daroniae]TBU75344.1 QacE family quaternary ammonium compound efflux SMR transporter [Pseudomonas daroniae]TBU77796.1 QacE family quaternary ammonium compound efflux SMR transporter [Pseudomonas sp. FRB 228]TBU87863.1 QacE family quaternary ammonium compound efflux SMR transporter [Pseudomonas daroniae]